MKQQKVELLAPAGNKEAFFGAIHAGADAVYLGGNKFGARAYADNFTTEELVSCIRYAHIFGRKVYLTVNTLIKDREWDQLYDYICPFYEAGLDGVIIQDLGVFLYLKEHFPGMELHISTQMTLTGVNGAAYLKSLGASRIVPARELSLEEIKTIKQQTGLEIEAFIHGAMCYCYSGQCLFSSILGGRSGNRGRCAQPCRLPYNVKGANIKGTYYPLSLKDMCTIEHLPELIESGIDSFKIEGRMKKAEYAAGVTAIYRTAIDRYYKAPKHFQVSAKELHKLSGLYIRSERQEGYYHKHNGEDMITLQNPAYSGNDEELLSEIRQKYLVTKPVFRISMSAAFTLGQPAELNISLEHPATGEILTVTATGEIVTAAQKQPILEEHIRKQLLKLGDTCFTTEELSVYAEEGIFYPLRALNELRRKAIMLLEDKLIASYGLPVRRFSLPENKLPEIDSTSCVSAPKKTALRISVRTKEQLKTVLNHIPLSRMERMYLCADLLTGQEGEECLSLLYHWKKQSANAEQPVHFFAVLPYILRKRDQAYLDALLKLLKEHSLLIEGCMVRSLEGYAYLHENEYNGKISADACFYIWNHKTLQYWQDKLDSFTLPYELNAGEQRNLLKGSTPTEQSTITAEKAVYGYLPMMITANCVLKTTGQCGKRNRTILGDRYQKRFPVLANCRHCMNVIYNSLPLSLHGTLSKWIDHVTPRLDFTLEGGEETAKIINYFLTCLNGGVTAPPYQDYTTGHEKRGVE